MGMEGEWVAVEKADQMLALLYTIYSLILLRGNCSFVTRASFTVIYMAMRCVPVFALLWSLLGGLGLGRVCGVCGGGVVGW